MNDLYIVLITVAFGIVLMLFFLKKWIAEASEKNKPSDDVVEWLKDVGKRIESSNLDFNRRLERATEVISKVQKNIGEFSEIGRDMRQLQQFLQSPKLRGNIGEQVLNDLLNQALPKSSFRLQYTFKSGNKVDAVIKTAKGLIPIDAKFPMSGFVKMTSTSVETDKKKYKKEFVRDVTKHIEDIAKKYILVDEGTVDYALMYIPSESVFYEIINNRKLYGSAGKKRILVVSPMSFYAYLKAILMSYEGQKIEKRAQEILSLLQSLKKDHEKTEEAMSILQKHITNAYNTMHNVSKHVLSLGQKLDSTHMLPSSKEKKI